MERFNRLWTAPAVTWRLITDIIWRVESRQLCLAHCYATFDVGENKNEH